MGYKKIKCSECEGKGKIEINNTYGQDPYAECYMCDGKGFSYSNEIEEDLGNKIFDAATGGCFKSIIIVIASFVILLSL